MGFFLRKADIRRSGIALDKYFLVTCGVNQGPRTPSSLAGYQQEHDSSSSSGERAGSRKHTWICGRAGMTTKGVGDAGKEAIEWTR
jgi:hypothetical protein